MEPEIAEKFNLLIARETAILDVISQLIAGQYALAEQVEAIKAAISNGE